MLIEGSFGIARAHKPANRKSLFMVADQCLYKAKETGKNKIIYNFTGIEETYGLE